MLKKFIVVIVFTLFGSCFSMDKPLHSAQGLGPHRAHLWNRDFLELALKRCRPSEAQTLLDVGCGQGDWEGVAYSLFRNMLIIV